jgi:hypothetical protein
VICPQKENACLLDADLEIRLRPRCDDAMRERHIDIGRAEPALLAGVLTLGIAVSSTQYAIAGPFAAPLVVGDRTQAMFDLWSLQHFCGGILIGALLVRFQPLPSGWRVFALAVGAIALSWEAIELAMEAGVFGAGVSRWKDGYEHWSNRLVGDPLLVVCGALVARRFAYAWKIAMAPASVWLLINVASPSSMYIQRLIF